MAETNLQAHRDQELFDRMAVNDLIQRERLARDSGLWDEMASYYHPDSLIDVSWFRGDGAKFVELSRKNAVSGPLNFHIMSAAVVTVRDDRAIAETPAGLRNFMQLGGVDVTRESFTRLLWRARRHNGNWLIAGLRCIYIRDLVSSCKPGEIPVIDAARLASYRPSYRYLAYMLTDLGLKPRDDLPGIDRPETVAALRADEQEWLQAGTS